jgi:Protein of unknown function (DUF2442)
MYTSTVEPIRATALTITDDELTVTITDGRILSVPLAWFPTLLQATSDQRNEWEWIGDGEGIHWPQLDEDLSISGLFAGLRPLSSSLIKKTRASVSRYKAALEKKILEAEAELLGHATSNPSGSKAGSHTMNDPSRSKAGSYTKSNK